MVNAARLTRNGPKNCPAKNRSIVGDNARRSAIICASGWPNLQNERSLLAERAYKRAPRWHPQAEILRRSLSLRGAWQRTEQTHSCVDLSPFFKLLNQVPEKIAGATSLIAAVR